MITHILKLIMLTTTTKVLIARAFQRIAANTNKTTVAIPRSGLSSYNEQRRGGRD